MRVAVVTFDGFNELDSLIAAHHQPSRCTVWNGCQRRDWE